MAGMASPSASIALPPIISVKELAVHLERPVTEVIAELMKNGVMATINEDIDYETAAIISADLGATVVPAKTEDAPDALAPLKEDQDAVSRPPVVTVLGHVDHGKTTLLDAIRRTDVAEGESGGITQHIGAYQVSVTPQGGKKERTITFLDTPGHEAFTAMRAHGTKMTDVAILVVAADDGVKPQTIEAINHIKSAAIPYVVAVTKVDKEGADLNRVKQELAEHDVVAEDWGGTIVFAPVSSKTREGLPELLEMVVLVSDIADPKANPAALMSAVVIESRLSRAKGPVATLLVRNGTLRVGDYVVAEDVTGRIRLMEDWHGKRVVAATPGTPVQVAGLSSVPSFGSAVQAATDEKAARTQAALNRRQQSARKMVRTALSAESLKRAVDRGKVKQLPLILVADVAGSLEAIEDSLRKIPQDEVSVQLVQTGVGAISESHVRTAADTGAGIAGFRARVETTAKTLAKQLDVQISPYEIIYQLLDDVRSALESLLPPEIIENEVGSGEVLAIFRTTKTSQIIGCRVEEKKFVGGVDYRVGDTGQEGRVTKLKRVEEVVQEVSAGTECGVTIEGPPVEVGQNITLFRRTEKSRTLAVTT